jgi:tetratricopeptide (TPR) repeat protein
VKLKCLVWLCAALVLMIPGISGSRASGGAASLEALFGAGKYDAAREVCRQRLTADPDSPDALYYLGRLSPDGASARSFYERLLAAHPSHHLADDAQLELAELAFGGPYELYRQARARYMDLLEAHAGSPHAAQALCRIGQTYLIEGATDSARAFFERCLGLEPRPGVAWLAQLGLAQADLQAGDSSAAAARMAAPGAGVPGILLKDLSKRLALVGTRDRSPGAQPVPARQTWIQVGAFRVAEYAASLVQRLKDAGLGAEDVFASGRGLHLVFAGPFVDRAQAKQALGRIQERTGIRGYILTRQ